MLCDGDIISLFLEYFNGLLASVVGIVAGIGAIAFYVATRLVEHYALALWLATTRNRIQAASLRSHGSSHGIIRFTCGSFY